MLLNKKLTIAVLTLGLLLTLASAAFTSETIKVLGQDQQRYERINASNPKFQQLSLKVANQPVHAFSRPDIAYAITPTAVLPPDYFCDPLFYNQDFAFYTLFPVATYDLRTYVFRMTPTEGYTCTLVTASVLFYGPAHVGTPNAYMCVYDENLTPLDSIYIPWATIQATGYGWLDVDMRALGLTFVDGEEFYIGLRAVPSVPGDQIAILITDVGLGDNRHAWYADGAAGYLGWYTFSSNRAYSFMSEVCCDRIPYSSCYTQEWDCATPYVYWWEQPNAWSEDYYSQRFTAGGGLDTLTEFGIALFSYAGYFEPVGAPDLDVFVWGDAGGFPDTTNVLYTTTIPFASLQFWPATSGYTSVTGLSVIVSGDFHIGWSVNDVSGGVLAALSDDGSVCGVGRSSVLWLPTGDPLDGYAWGSILEAWGADVNFWIYADICKDEFSECQNISYYTGIANFWYLPDRYGDYAQAVRFTPFGEGCRLETMYYALYWHPARCAAPWNLYTENSQLQVFDNTGRDGLPGNLLGSIDLTPADYYAVCGYYVWNSRSFHDQNIRFDADVWCGIESQASDTLTGILVLSDAVGTAPLSRTAENWLGDWEYVWEAWPWDWNTLIDIDVCCVPIAEIACTGGESWPVKAHDDFRTNHSLNSIGDAQCNLTKAWQYNTVQTMVYGSPVIWEDIVVALFGDRLVTIDLNTGTQINQKLATDFGSFVLASGMFSTPSVKNWADYGMDQTLVYVAGAGARAFSAFNINTLDTVWSRKYDVHGTNTFTYGQHCFVDVGGVPYLIYWGDGGDMYACNAMTGASIWGPINVGGNVTFTAVTDGELVFVGHDENVTNGDVKAYDPSDGSLVWSLSTVNGGLLGGTVVPAKDYPGTEGFLAGMSYDAAAGKLYVVSSYNPADNSTPVQDGGVMYRINAADGVVDWVQLSNGGLGSAFATPAIDASKVIFQGWCPWTTSGQRRGPIAYIKNSGVIAWANTLTNPGSYSPADGGFAHNWLMDGMLSCEPGVADFYIAQMREDYLNVFNADDGTQLWHRRFALGQNRAHRTAPVMDDGHVLVVWGWKMFCLTNQTDRQRLNILNYKVDVPVEFGGGTSEIITFADIFENNGCAPLTIFNVTIDENTNGTVPPVASFTVGEDRIGHSEQYLAKMTNKAEELVRDIAQLGADVAIENMRSSSSRASYAPPAFLNAIVSPTPNTIVNPGAPPVDIVLDVNASIITRGAHVFYAFINSDDPDYFLDSAYMNNSTNYLIPAVELTVVGGCLYDVETLEFGATGDLNFTRVYNSGKLADGDVNEFDVDGYPGEFWQAGIMFGNAKYRLAFHSDNWSGGDWEWNTLLADVNCATAQCEIGLETNALLGYISLDQGSTYEPLYGEVATIAFVDSVQNFYDTLLSPRRWNWDWHDTYGESPPYDDTLTMGFKACGKVIGAYTADKNGVLDNFVIYRYAVYSRYGQAVNDMYVGAFIDYDVGPNNKNNVTGYNKAHSVAWSYDCATPIRAFGMVKIPFGGCYEPLINARGLDGRPGGFWNDSHIWLDSAYNWMSSPLWKYQLIHQPGILPCVSSSTDRESFFTLQTANLPAWAGTADSTIVCFANFGLEAADASDPSNYFELANMANKWAGFGRGDVNNDGMINLVDIVYLANFVLDPINNKGPYPFKYSGDVNADGSYTAADVTYLINYYFNGGADPLGAWEI